MLKDRISKTKNFQLLLRRFMQSVNQIFPLLLQPHDVVITTHQKPDGDAMGSSLGLYNFLIQFGHEVTVISPTNWAGWVNWMPGAKEVMDYEMDKQKAEKVLDDAEWLFCLDFNIFYRTKININWFMISMYFQVK